MFVNDSTPTTSGWAGTVYNGNAAAQPATTTAICATVKKVSGDPPPSSKASCGMRHEGAGKPPAPFFRHF